ncbi:MAG: polymer-forming cytoskeletal protein [Gammaproteobacteria bacterium]|nr:polymer-forming cytoskeletal protein [Gammaproteobacteria bacterium]
MRRILDKASGPTTFIGEDASFLGDIEGNGHFVICGAVTGNCKLDGPLTIAVTGRWKGRIEARDIVIAGQVDGDVFAEGKLEVAASARIDGNLSGRSVAVAEGAVIEGGINVQGETPLITFTDKRKSE